jgi:hypothetical protein
MREQGPRVLGEGMANFDLSVRHQVRAGGVEPSSRRTPRCSPDERFDRLQSPCPTCGLPGVRIVYGYPTGPLMAAARRGKVIVGGCTYRSATHRCPDGHEWECPGAQH